MARVVGAEGTVVRVPVGIAALVVGLELGAATVAVEMVIAGTVLVVVA